MNYVKSYRLIYCLYVLPGNSRLMCLGNMLLLLYALPRRQNKTPLLIKPAHVTSVISSPPPHHLFVFSFLLPSLLSNRCLSIHLLLRPTHLAITPWHPNDPFPPLPPVKHLSAPLSHFIFSSPCWAWWPPLGSLRWCWTCPRSPPPVWYIPAWRSRRGRRLTLRCALSQRQGWPARRQRRTTYLKRHMMAHINGVYHSISAETLHLSIKDFILSYIILYIIFIFSNCSSPPVPIQYLQYLIVR